MGRVTAALGTALTALAALALAGSACTASAAQVRYMLWDSSQLPAYRQCAADFAVKHPGTTIKISQAGWGDYWTAISTGFIAESAPDVFVNHLSQYPQYVSNELLLDLTPYIRRDGLDLGRYQAGLAAVWARGGRQYGLPKDWDTVALAVNLNAARAAGVTLDELKAMRWNPQDGGTFETVLRKLTRDAQGRNALHPQFNPRQVLMYGYQNPGPGGMAGQTEWSHFAASAGATVQAAPWALPLRYDQPAVAQTLDWLAGLPAKGLSAPLAQMRSMGAGAMFAAGQVAMVPDGAWMIGYYAGIKRFDTAWVPLPIGPSGHRASMINGVADSIWVGSKVKEEAWAWVKYLASADCQQVVARHGVVFPALRGLAEQVVAGHARQRVDAQAFLTMAADQTFGMPVAEQGAQVEAIVKGAIESVLLGKQRAAPALREAQRQIDQLLRAPPPPAAR